MCDAGITFSLKKCKPSASHPDCHCLDVNINWYHNHRTNECLHANKFKKVKKSVEEKFLAMFDDNKSATEALKEYTCEIN